MRLSPLVHLMLVYMSANAAASAALGGLEIDLVLFAVAVGATGGVTMRIAAYDSDEISRAEFMRKVMPSAWIGGACGFLIYLLCSKFRMDAVTSMMLAGSGGLAGREVLALARRMVVRVAEKLF